MSWRLSLSVLAVLCLPSLFAAGGGVAQADASSCSVFRAPVYAHPGHDRYIYLSCGGPSNPASVTVEGPDHGTLIQGATIMYLYRPPVGYLGPDHFTLHPTGDDGPWAPISVEVTVGDTLNTAPDCSYGSSGVVRDGETRNVHILSCEDVESDPARFDIVTPPAHGTLGTPTVRSISSTNTAEWPYTPDAGYTGSDAFTYRATDDHGGVSESRTAAITVHAADFNQVPGCMSFPPFPLPKPLPYSWIIHGTTMLSAGCSDADEDPLTPTVTTPPAHGTLGNLDGYTFSYVPDPGYAGQDSFAFTVADGHGGVSSPATHTLDLGPNHAPTCSDLAATVAPRATAAAKPTNFTLPCTDPDEDQLTLVVDHAPVHGQLVRDAILQQLIYTPDIGYGGQDVATFHVTDGNGGASAPRSLRLGVGEAPADGSTPPATHGDPAPPPGPPVDRAPPIPITPRVVAASLAAQAAALLGTTGKPLDLGLGTAAQAFTVVARKGVKIGAPLAIVFCRSGCTVGVDGRVALGGSGRASKATLRLAHRTLKVVAAKPGVVRLTPTRAQRARIAHARHASVLLTLTTRAGGKTKRVRRSFAIRR